MFDKLTWALRTVALFEAVSKIAFSQQQQSTSWRCDASIITNTIAVLSGVLYAVCNAFGIDEALRNEWALENVTLRTAFVLVGCCVLAAFSFVWILAGETVLCGEVRSLQPPAEKGTRCSRWVHISGQILRLTLICESVWLSSAPAAATATIGQSHGDPLLSGFRKCLTPFLAQENAIVAGSLMNVRAVVFFMDAIAVPLLSLLCQFVLARAAQLLSVVLPLSELVQGRGSLYSPLLKIVGPGGEHIADHVRGSGSEDSEIGATGGKVFR